MPTSRRILALYFLVIMSIGYGLIERYVPITVVGNLTIGRLFLIGIALSLLVYRTVRLSKTKIT